MIYDSKQFVGNIIKNARKRLGLKQVTLAEQIGMSEKNLGNIECGKQYPLLNNFFRILEVLKLSVSDFGVITTEIPTPSKDELLKEIYCLSEDDSKHLLSIIKSIKSIKLPK